ncbi:MAG: tetratricopeptide repeat protein [Pirellula sp.]
MLCPFSLFTEAIRLDPKNAITYSNRGSALFLNGDFDSAIKDYTEAIRLDPKYADASNGLAWFYATCPDAEHRDGEKAVELATKACELSAWKTWFHVVTLADAYAESDDWENAVKYQEKAIELTTDERNKAIGRERLELYKKKEPYRQGVKKK